MEAILSLVEDKEKMCKRFGAQYVARAWPAQGFMPFMFVTDRGSEYIGYDSDRIAEDVESALVNLPAYFSSRKGTVECSFKLIHVPLKDRTAGYQPPSEVVKRHGDCYAHDAEYTLDELHAELIDIITMHNLRMHPGMARDLEPVLEGVDPIPADVWEYDAKNRSGAMLRYDADYLRMKLLHKRRAVVTQNGVRLNGLFYTCQHAIDHQWFVKGGKAVFAVSVTYDRRLTDTIFIHDPKNPRRYYEATLTKACRMYAGMSHAEASVVVRLRKDAKKRAEDHNLLLELELDAKRRARAERASLETAAAIAAAAGQARQSASKQVRDDEAKERRQKLAAEAIPGSSEASSTGEPSPKQIKRTPSTQGPSAKLPLDNPLQALLEMDDD
jgi:putative transposase